MELIPVLDLAGGVAVHARRGERERYRPVESRLAPGTADPLVLCRAFRKVGFRTVYVADLDAIAGRGSHADLTGRIAQETGLRVMLDCGVRSSADLPGGVAEVVVGSETLRSLSDLRAMVRTAGRARLTFSLDLKQGQVLSPDERLARLPPLHALSEAVEAGVTRTILLDLSAVGSGAGPNLDLLGRACAVMPRVQLLAGGGVRDVHDLAELRAAGAYGALVATCLHTGAISGEELQPWLS
jgi:phosphoribosylformimino-5-aminoimidazole carboxamide ribotide isomerase